MKARAELIRQYYVNISEIKELLQIPRRNAEALFREIDKQEERKPFRAHYKVPLMDVLKLAGVDYGFLSEQIKEEG